MLITTATRVATALRVAPVVHDVKMCSDLTAGVPVLPRNVSRLQTLTLVATRVVTACIVVLHVKTAGIPASTSTATAPATTTMNGHSGALTVASRSTVVSVDSATKAAVCASTATVEQAALYPQVRECSVQRIAWWPAKHVIMQQASQSFL